MALIAREIFAVLWGICHDGNHGNPLFDCGHFIVDDLKSQGGVIHIRTLGVSSLYHFMIQGLLESSNEKLGVEEQTEGFLLNGPTAFGSVIVGNVIRHAIFSFTTHEAPEGLHVADEVAVHLLPTLLR
jgi:hypothetical protein